MEFVIFDNNGKHCVCNANTWQEFCMCRDAFRKISPDPTNWHYVYCNKVVNDRIMTGYADSLPDERELV